MGWREEIRRPASFRGVPFEMQIGSKRGGRRTVVNEYPQQDEATVEDLGLRAAQLPVTGFVVGDDYLEQRKRLEDALETPGLGVLDHPYRGRLLVAALEYEATDSSAEQRTTRFTITFQRAGQPLFPTITTDTATKILSKKDLAVAGAKSIFESLWDDGPPGWVGDSALLEINTQLAAIRAVVVTFGGALDDVSATLAAIDTLTATAASLTPSALADDLLAALETIGNRLAHLEIVAGLASLTEVVAVTPNAAREQENARAFQVLIRRDSLALAAEAASLESFANFDEGATIRDQLVDLMTTELAEDDLTTDAWTAFDELRGTTAADIDQRIQDLPRLRTHTPAVVVSSLELAQRLYSDGERADEIVELNKAIGHPGFIPPDPIRVLSS
jgi:prophage DNA circulation protein